MADRKLLLPTFLAVADTLVDDFDLVEMLDLVTERAVAIFGVAAAGIMLNDANGQLVVMSSSSEAMRVLEVLESQASEGPCPECFRTGRPVVAQDLASALPRWPEFAPRALAAGFISVQALPMRVRGAVIGAFNLFSTEPAELEDDDLSALQALADVCTIAILQYRATASAEQLARQLTTALESRVVIEQAKGVLAERGASDVATAFAELRRHARNKNLRLIEVARGVVAGTIQIESGD